MCIGIVAVNMILCVLSFDTAVRIQRPVPRSIHLRASSFLLFDLIGMCASLFGSGRPFVYSSIVFVNVTSDIRLEPEYALAA